MTDNPTPSTKKQPKTSGLQQFIDRPGLERHGIDSLRHYYPDSGF